MGNVSWTCPTIHPELSIAPEGTAGHSIRFRDAAATPKADRTTLLAAIARPQVAWELFADPELVAAAWRDFRAAGLNRRRGQRRSAERRPGPLVASDDRRDPVDPRRPTGRRRTARRASSWPNEADHQVRAGRRVPHEERRRRRTAGAADTTQIRPEQKSPNDVAALEHRVVQSAVDEPAGDRAVVLARDGVRIHDLRRPAPAASSSQTSGL